MMFFRNFVPTYTVELFPESHILIKLLESECEWVSHCQVTKVSNRRIWLLGLLSFIVRIEAENIQHVWIIWTFGCFFISPDPRLLACRAGDGV